MTNVAPQRILPASDRVLLVEYDSLDAVLGHFAALDVAGLVGVTELIPAADTIMVHYDPLRTTPEELAQRIREVPALRHIEHNLETMTIDVVYAGEDLEEVAKSLHVGVDELIRRHTGATWSGAFAGFAPGFVYCVGDDPLFDVPRRSSPRARIPAGSVAVASNFSAVYPRESPGGWQLLGRTAQPMWDLERETPAAVQPGQQVQYRAVRDTAILTQHEPMASGLRPVPDDTPYLEVVKTGAQMLVQDTGRPGHTGLGVSASGAADRRALHRANRAVGNDRNVGALEIAGGGAELLSNVRTVVVLTGATSSANIVSADDEVLPLRHSEPTAIEAGDSIHIGALTDGIRTYLAVRGGFKLPPILTSLATDTLSGIGPTPLTTGDRLPIGDKACVHAVQPLLGPVHSPDNYEKDATPQSARSAEPCQLRVVLGPRTDWFTEQAIEDLTGQDWTVTPNSDRVGLRLQGEFPLDRAITRELPSEGAVTGAIQVPPDGQPVLFMPDHPLTAGYPIIGAVIDEDLDLAGQLAPGMNLRFRIVRQFTEF